MDFVSRNCHARAGDVMNPLRSEARLDESLSEITRLLEKHRVLETLTHRQEGPKRDLLEHLQHRQNLTELQMKVKTLHPADVAHILELLPLDERLLVWHQVPTEGRGEVLVELSGAVLDSLLEHTDRQALVSALANLDAEDLGELADQIPEDLFRDVSKLLDARDRSWLQASIAYDENTVGSLMSQEMTFIREQQTVEEIVGYLRSLGELPEQTDQLFVVDARHVLKGAVPLPRLLLHAPGLQAMAIMDADVRMFRPHDGAQQVANAFERYDLVTAAVVDERGKLNGRLTVDSVMDFVRQEAEQRALERAGLRGEEDLFASVWDSAKNRALWLFVNLITAFLASRVIQVFETTIAQLVALATLMPIVASVGGNTGNQTIALVVRGLALDQVNSQNSRYMLTKEVTVSLVNGLMWGSLMALFAFTIYRSATLALVMMAAVVLNLLVAAVVGVAVPLVLHKAGRDPAQGASVLLTFITDSMGFFLFLGLARLFLV
jgi:magnesium transporter